METRTFNNGFEVSELETVHERVNSREDDIRQYMNSNNMYETGNDDLPPFNEYGLCFDYVEAEIDNDDEVHEDYFRFQISWGGPSFEFRIYEDRSVYSVYMDWFKGYSEESSNDVAEWLYEWFEGCEMLNFESKREEYDYISIIYAEELAEMAE